MSSNKILEELSVILGNILSNDGQIRNESEKKIVIFLQDPNSSFLYLSETLNYSNNKYIRMLASILLKQQLSIELQKNPWNSLSQPIQEQVK